MKNANKLLKAGMVLFVGSLAVGFLTTVFSMVRTFETLGDSGSHVAASDVADAISYCMIVTSISTYVALFSLCLIIGGVIVYFAKKRGGNCPFCSEENSDPITNH